MHGMIRLFHQRQPLIGGWTATERRVWRGFSSTSTCLGLNVLFFGTDDFAAKALKALAEDRKSENPIVSKLAVVRRATQYHRTKTNKGKPKIIWRAATDPVAARYRLETYDAPDVLKGWVAPLVEDKETGSSSPYDIGVVASFGKYISGKVIESFPKGMINVHPSLLPKYRGPSPIQTAILEGVKDTGLTIQEVHPTVMDGGKILAQIPYQINDRAKYPEVAVELGKQGGALAVQVLSNLDTVRRRAQEQDKLQVTLTRLYTRFDQQITWERMTADEIERKHRAFYMQEPVYTFLRVKNKNHQVQFLELTKADPSMAPIREDYLDFPPGTVFFKKKVPYIELHCIDGSRIRVTRFRVSGKADRDTFQFAAGYYDKKRGSRFLSVGADTRRPTPPFVYPAGYTRPVIEAKWAAGQKKSKGEIKSAEQEQEKEKAE
ncbi:Methionyl-tRNA formyltransferase [Coemansia sp. RSA 2703]|nr:Methionyl-tRNA formyltransferase [Coemansia sp. RSA 2703]KAJ2362395.1 Methionyl-tRNA formyltransferase [Coemansia sp. RSA 2607]KAJ2381513.1 Methionyl-tRNA formyltransferase [Coemansia sp. RSA 2603]